MNNPLDKINADLVPFGKHKGKHWQEVPKSYLEYIVNNTENKGENSNLCEIELTRRGGRKTELKVYMPGYDSASLCCIDMWLESNRSEGTNVGFNTYVFELAKYVLENGQQVEHGVMHYQGIKFTYDIGEIYPTLKNVSRIPT